PVLLGSTQQGNALRNGAIAHGGRPSHSVLDSSLVGSGVGKNAVPALAQCRDILLSKRHDDSPFKLKTFLSVRTKRSPQAIFLTKEDTTDSRSRRRPCTCSTRSRMSDMCKGLPARRSTSCTISSCDVRCSCGGGSGPFWDFARRMARNWASRAI